ncbi:MAG: hypothetical protein HYS27_23725 [Deltaproteobacteria bacterium]|nr:hypothetical protein [Deltaproteobacteria bacterium]
MPEKRLEAVVDGRRIVAINTWFSGERLEIDGAVIAKANHGFNVQEDEPLLSAVVTGDSGLPLHVEVFIAAVLTVRMMIVVNGRYVAGDRMNDKEAAAGRRAEERLRAASSGGGGGTSVAVPAAVDRRRS